jgi:uncharacterized protein YndB with AHSA1/START domain
MSRAINQQYFFSHPPEVVWDYLTKSELLEQWLMKNDFQPIVGHEFQFRTNPLPDLNFDGIFHCTVLEIIPFKKLSYSWNGGPGDGTITCDSIVVWTLQPKDNGTDLFLVHSGFSNPESIALYTGMLNGWLKKMEKLTERINAAQHGTTNA